MSDPLLVNELEDESLRNQFNFLLEAMESITTFDPNREEGAYDALNQRIQQEVTDKPILASIVSVIGKSLLEAAVSYLNLDTSQTVITCLIQTYPSALLGTSDGYLGRTIFLIACHPQHCVLMPWIATNYHWVLDHSRGQRVVFDLLDMYTKRRRNSCTSTIIKDFFKAYPRALEQEHGTLTILHNVLKSYHRDNFNVPDRESSQVEADLVKWIAERCPSSTLLETDSFGNTPLHHACRLLSKHKTCNLVEICKYLIQKCPGSIRMLNDADTVTAELPIHILQTTCDYRVVREVVVCLFREYPESIDIWANGRFGSTRPSSVPFIQSIKPHLDEEKELKETAVSLKESISSLIEAVACTEDQLIRSASTVFDSWSTSFIKTTEDKINSIISVKLQEMCNEGREYENRERQIQRGIMDMISSLH